MPSERSTARFSRAAWLAVGLAWLAFALLAAWRWHGRALDDFFITFRYAQNFAAGNGLVFNVGEHAFGTTAPGYALLLGLLAAATRLPPHVIAGACTALALPLAAALLAVDSEERRLEAVAGGTLLVTSTYVWIHQGSELPVVLVALAAAGLASRRHETLAGVMAGLAAWCRPDAVLGAAALGLSLWIRRRRLPWRYGLAVGVVGLVGLAIAHWWFGQLLPGTLEAKRAQAAWMPEQWPSGAAFWEAGRRSLRMHWAGTATDALLAIGIVGQVPLLRRAGPALQAIAAYGLLMSAAYPLLGVPFYSWYAVPGVVAVLYGVPFAVGAVLRWVRRRIERPMLRWLATGAILAAVAWPLANPVQRAWALALHPPAGTRWELYRQAGTWLSEHAAPGERFAAIEVGTIAYYSRHDATDLMGLVSPEVLPRVWRRDLPGAFLRHPASWLFESSRSRAGAIPERRWFVNRYAIAMELSVDQTWGHFYRLVPGASLPNRRLQVKGDRPAP